MITVTLTERECSIVIQTIGFVIKMLLKSEARKPDDRLVRLELEPIRDKFIAAMLPIQ